MADFTSISPALAEISVVAGAAGIGLLLYRMRASRRDAPVIVLGHCNGFAAGCYLPLLEKLAGVADVFAFDQRGHGGAQSPGDPSGLTAEALADDVAAIIAAVAQCRPGAAISYVGHSLSAAAMLHLAITRPASYSAMNLAHVVLIEPPVFPASDHPLFAECTRSTIELVARTHRRRTLWPSPVAYARALSGRGPFASFAPEMLAAVAQACLRPQGSGYVLACAPATEARIFALWGKPILFPQLTAVPSTHRVLLVSGDPEAGPARDWVTAMMADVAARISHARLAVQRGRGHLWPFEAPAEAMALIRTEILTNGAA